MPGLPLEPMESQNRLVLPTSNVASHRKRSLGIDYEVPQAPFAVHAASRATAVLGIQPATNRNGQSRHLNAGHSLLGGLPRKSEIGREAKKDRPG